MLPALQNAPIYSHSPGTETLPSFCRWRNRSLGTMCSRIRVWAKLLCQSRAVFRGPLSWLAPSPQWALCTDSGFYGDWEEAGHGQSPRSGAAQKRLFRALAGGPQGCPAASPRLSGHSPGGSGEGGRAPGLLQAWNHSGLASWLQS